MDPHINPASGVWDDNYYAASHPSGGGDGGGASAPAFDFLAAAKQAYGDLAPYYDRLLSESKGDLTLALARLNEDYNRGLRVQTENTNTRKTAIDTTQAEADRVSGIQKRDLAERENARGLLRLSSYDPNAQNNPGNLDQPGFGLASRAIGEFNAGKTYQTGVRTSQKSALDTALSRYTETAGINKGRKTTDLTTSEQRKEFNLEQQRRQQAAGMANTLGQQDYQAFLANPSLV